MQLIPGGPFTSERGVSDVTLAALKAKYGLDKPLFVQYLIYIGRSFTFNFGPSMKIKGTEVMPIMTP